MQSKETRIVRFPDSSVGNLHVGDCDNSDLNNWKFVGPARGEVVIPKRKDLMLVLEDISWLFYAHYDIEPGDLQVLSIPEEESFGLEEIGIDGIERLTGLIEIDLSFTHVVDSLMGSLLPLSSLKKLDLSYTDISDKSLEVLWRLSSLKTLDLTRNKITPDGLMWLRGCMPGCLVVG